MVKEKWTKGAQGGCVVSDMPNRDADSYYSENDEREAFEYYGGYLIAESIPKREYVNLIAAAPDLLDACKETLVEMRAYNAESEFDDSCPMKPTFDQLKAAIAKAEGKEAKDV